MARWRLYWLTMAAVYVGIVGLAILAHEGYWWWLNGLVLIGPPVLGYVVGRVAERR